MQEQLRRIRDSRKLGELLLDVGKITENQLELALNMASKGAVRLGEVLVLMGALTEEDIARTLSKQLGIRYTDCVDEKVSQHAIELIPEKIARKHLALPLTPKTFVVADPLNFAAIDELSFIVGGEISLLISTPALIKMSIDRHYNLYSLTKNQAEAIVSFQREGETSTTIGMGETSDLDAINKLVNNCIANAINKRASELSIEDAGDGIIVRESVHLPKWTHNEVLERIKQVTGLELNEKVSKEASTLTVSASGKTVDVAVKIVPGKDGERVVMHILGSDADAIELEAVH